MKHPRNVPGPHRGPAILQPIPSSQLWPLEFFHSVCGYGSQARAEAQRLGLPVYTWARRSWISTDDLIAFLKREGVKSEQGDVDHERGDAAAVGTTQDSSSGGETPKPREKTIFSRSGCGGSCKHP